MPNTLPMISEEADRVVDFIRQQLGDWRMSVIAIRGLTKDQNERARAQAQLDLLDELIHYIDSGEMDREFMAEEIRNGHIEVIWGDE